MPALTPPEQPLNDGVVSLRAYRHEDRDAVVAAVQDPQIPRWTGVPSRYGFAEYDGWMAQQDEQREAGTGLHFLIVDGEDTVLGATGVQLSEDTPDIGYWCVRKHRRQGYVTRAVRLLCRHVLSLGFPCVDVLVHEDNRPSQRVAEAAGFTRRPGLHTVTRLGDAPVYIRFTSP